MSSKGLRSDSLIIKISAKKIPFRPSLMKPSILVTERGLAVPVAVSPLPFVFFMYIINSSFAC